jgi:hypothetical protein
MQQIQSKGSVQPVFPIHEYEQLESFFKAIVPLKAWFDDRTAELEKITRPQKMSVKPAIKTIGPGLEYMGVMTLHWYYIDIYIDLLQRLWASFPEKRDQMAAAIAYCGRTRPYVARSQIELFPGQSLRWIEKHSRLLMPGWYIDTNLSRERMCRILPVAVEAAGLKWRVDVKVYWYPTKGACESTSIVV